MLLISDIAAAKMLLRQLLMTKIRCPVLVPTRRSDPDLWILTLIVINEKGVSMPKYGKKAGETVKRAMEKMKSGKLKSGKSGKKVTSKKQAVAIGLSEARKKGAKVPKKKS